MTDSGLSDNSAASGRSSPVLMTACLDVRRLAKNIQMLACLPHDTQFFGNLAKMEVKLVVRNGGQTSG